MNFNQLTTMIDLQTFRIRIGLFNLTRKVNRFCKSSQSFRYFDWGIGNYFVLISVVAVLCMTLPNNFLWRMNSESKVVNLLPSSVTA